MSFLGIDRLEHPSDLGHLAVRHWTELLAGDEALTTAILDRLLHRAHVINIKGRGYRLRDLENLLDNART